MSQGAIVVPDSNGTTFLSNLNAALARLQTRGSGTSRPSDIGTYELWIETDNPGTGIVSVWQYDGSSDVLWALLNTSAHSIAFYSGGALLATQSYVTTAVGAAVAFKNRFVNGGLGIDQRNEGSSQTFTAAAAIAYCVDRWYGSCTGANVTGQRVAGTGANRYAYKFTGAASVTGVLFGQRIEVANIYDLAGADVVVSLQVKSSSLTSLTWTAYYANSADDFSSKTQIATGTISSISSALASKSFTFNAGANAVNGIAIEFTGGALLATHTLQFEALQIESGTTASAFEMLPAGIVLERCQRYYEKSYAPGVALATVTTLGMAGGGTWCTSATGIGYQGPGIPFKVTKRGTPTIALYAPSDGSSGKADWNANGANGTATSSANNVGASGFSVSTNAASGRTAGQGADLFCHYTASAEL